jgi:hypothetical protein
MSYQRLSRQSGVGLALALAVVACGGASLNQAKLAETQTAMQAAETLGAANDPKAKQSLQRARDELAEAKRLAKDGDEDRGNLYLERATADAELASQLKRTASEEEKARAAWAKSKAMVDVRAPQ